MRFGDAQIELDATIFNIAKIQKSDESNSALLLNDPERTYMSGGAKFDRQGLISAQATPRVKWPRA